MEHQNEHRMEAPGRRGVSRIEVLDGPTGRRRWPDDVKARVCDVAQKPGLIARHLSQWRGLARKGKLVLSCDDGPAFVPLMLEPVAEAEPVVAMAEGGVVKIEIAGTVLHVPPDCSPDCAAALAAALKRAL